MLFRPFSAALCAALLLITPAHAALDSATQQEVRITRITPEGEDVAERRQIVITFNRPMVPLGRMERHASELPVSITPALDCQWRWLNRTALACQLGDETQMKPATAYKLHIEPGIMAEDGATIASAKEHRFITQRPQVRQPSFGEWKSPSWPVVRLQFNQPVTRDSVERHIAFTYGEERVKAKAHADEQMRENPRYVIAPGESYMLDFGRQDGQKPADRKTEKGGVEARSTWLLEPVQELPLDTHVAVQVEPGLVSALGAETGVERRAAVTFDTYPELEFLGIKCRTNDNKELRLAPAKAVDGEKKCSPLKGVALSFSAPVDPAMVRDAVTITPDLAGGRKDYDPWANTGANHAGLRWAHKKGRSYEVWLPERLKARTAYHIASAELKLRWWQKIWAWAFGAPHETDIQDMFGRELAQQFSLRFTTDDRPANYVLPHDDAVLEKGIDSEVPLYVTNLESATLRYRRMGDAQPQERILTPAKVENLQFAIPVGLRDMLGGESGVVSGNLTTSPEVRRQPQRFLWQVTPYAVHGKLGHFNTLVWVTELATGKPAQGVRVGVYLDEPGNLLQGKEPLATGITDASGIARIGKGRAAFDPHLQYGWGRENLIIRADKGDDTAYMPLNYHYEVDVWRSSGNRFGTNLNREFGHIHTWGTTAQGVYRVGDTIQYKLFVRHQDNYRYTPAPEGNYTLTITDPLGNEVHKREGITLSAFGTYAGEYPVPANGAMGWYQFALKGDFAEDTWFPLQVLVTDFTPAAFKVSNSLNGDLFHAGAEVRVDTQAKLHSGGAYTDAEARITGTLKPRGFSSKEPALQGFVFDTGGSRRDSQQMFQKQLQLGDKGEAAQSFTLPESDIAYGRLTVESAVRDDRGKYIASQSGADYFGVNRFVGLRSAEWVYNQGKPAAIGYVVVDEQGKPASNHHVDILIERQEMKAAKVKGAGNAYLTQYTETWVKAGECGGLSGAAPRTCRFTPDKPGNWRLTASIADTGGNPHSTQMQVYVVGGGYVQWHMSEDNALEILPEKTNYQVGDTAKYLVKNPFPGAQALVTVERYGILRQWVQVLEGSTPTIELPVEKDYLPGFFLSVVVQSPRVEAAPPRLGQVDMGKPAFRMGYAQTMVDDPYKMLDLTVTTDAGVYKPRDNVTAQIHVEPRHKDTDEPIEIAVAVVDEAVLDLIRGGTAHYDPYAGFNRLDGLDMTNHNLLRQLVGRQYFEKKGANPGGDGGADLAMRTLFKFVSYWNPGVTPDKNGNATVSFEVPDNLTGWRVLAFATTPTDRMGLGHSAFKVNQPTEIRPVMPNQLREGDSFRAGFSIMNRTDAERTLSVTVDAEGTLAEPQHLETTLTLAPYKRGMVYLPIVAGRVPATREVAQGQLTFRISAQDGEDGDALTHSLPVYKQRSLLVAANYGTTTQNEVTESIAFPEGIRTDVGKVDVVLSPSVIGNVEGAFAYMRDYPYMCWEQRLSKGTMAAHFTNLRAYMPDSFVWAASGELPQETLDTAAQFQTPSGAMSYYIPDNTYADPYLSAYTALAFNWLRVSGHAVPQTVEAKLHGYLQRLLRRDEVPDFFTEGMTATVRAVALAALAEHGKATRDDIARYQPHMPRMSLFGKAHYLLAAQQVEGSETAVKETATAILASASQTGGKVLFNEELDDGYSRILATPLRENCAVLSALVGYAGSSKEAAEQVGDIPFRMVRAITQTRGNRDHWENTQENMFCLNALTDFARVYEDVQPDMTVTATLGTRDMGRAVFTALRDEAVTLATDILPADEGQKRELAINRDGTGRLYYASRLHYAPQAANSTDINAGIDIRKEYAVERDGEWGLLKPEDEVKQGELVRVDIFISLPAARHFVVVDDPVPGGLEPVNRDLATSSEVDAAKGDFTAAGGSWWFKFSDWRYFGTSRWNFYHREMRHDAVRFYSDYLPAGNYSLNYTAQAIASGSFARLPAHAEEMYDPDVFGKSAFGTLTVKP